MSLFVFEQPTEPPGPCTSNSGLIRAISDATCLFVGCMSESPRFQQAGHIQTLAIETVCLDQNVECRI